ncbi:MAG: tRNA-guanine transglycosylase, partial [Nitrospirota bacterium]|nr:tRNA-guanine transglycosylase [Nitrospirota bacterium]
MKLKQEITGPHFQVLSQLKNSPVRRGRLRTPHGCIETPAFMTVGTAGTVKAMDPVDLKNLGAEIILCNAY